MIPEGATCDALVGMNDFMATFAELTDGEMGDEEAPDSISFAKLLRDPEVEGTRKNLIMESVRAFVVRDGDWKLCVCPGSGTPADSENAAGSDPMPGVAWRAALDQFGGTPVESDLLKAPFVQLFNLANDIHEDVNLAAEHPERVAQMVALLRKQIADGRSTPGPVLKNDKNVKVVSLEDRRLPEFVRALVK